MKFDPGGKAHSIIRCVSELSATPDQVWEALGLSKSHRTKVAFLMRVFRNQGMLEQLGEAYAITDKGLDVLAAFEAGEALEVVDAAPNGHHVPTVRMFNRRAA